MESSSSVSPMQHRIVWSLRILLALTFGAAGIAKLAGIQQLLGLLSAFVAWRQRPVSELAAAG